MANEDKNVYAAISLAIHEFMGNNVHDEESGKITIVLRNTQWNERLMMMTLHP